MYINDLNREAFGIWVHKFFSNFSVEHYQFGFSFNKKGECSFYVSFPLKGNKTIISELESLGWSLGRRKIICNDRFSSGVFYQDMFTNDWRFL